MTRTPEEAIVNARSKHRPGLFATGTCLMQVRICYGIGSKFPSAAKAWAGAQRKHRATAEHCPRGVPVFWVGGSHSFGHIAISLGDGLCETTDFVNRGGFGIAHIDDITRRWGLTFEGWTEDLNGVQIWSAPVPVQPRKAVPVTPYDHAYELAEEIVATGKHVQKKYVARRRLIDGVAALLKVAPAPASRKVKK